MMLVSGMTLCMNTCSSSLSPKGPAGEQDKSEHGGRGINTPECHTKGTVHIELSCVLMHGKSKWACI